MQKQRQILWGPTLQVNAVRLVCCAIVWFIIMSITSNRSEDLLVVIGFPLLYIPIAGIAMLFRGTVIGGFFNLAALITILPADPLVFLLRLIARGLVPIQYYSPLMFNYFLYIHD